MSVRVADADRDADAVAAIYRPAVESSIASFEETPPDTAEMARRMRLILARTPWLVTEDQGSVVGYAYAGHHRERPGYRWSVDISVYVAAAQHGRGIGRALYDELLRLLRRQGFVNAYAGIALPNPASVALHEKLGFKKIAQFAEVGWKFDRWVDVGYWQLIL